jgi:hypothetical protein
MTVSVQEATYWQMPSWPSTAERIRRRSPRRRSDDGGKRSAYPLARRLLITADGGGSNGSRVHLWKLELHRLADELDISIEVHHLTPGNQQMEQDRAPAVLVHYPELARQTAAQLSRHRRFDRSDNTQTGLKVLSELDHKSYSKGSIVSDQEMASLDIKRRFPRRMELRLLHQTDRAKRLFPDEPLLNSPMDNSSSLPLWPRWPRRCFRTEKRTNSAQSSHCTDVM